MKQRRILSAIMAVPVIMSMGITSPTAFAVETESSMVLSEESPAPVCSCTTRCAEDAVSDVCEVCEADWTQCVMPLQAESNPPQQSDGSSGGAILEKTRSDIKVYSVSNAVEFNRAITDIGSSNGNEFEIILENDLSGVAFAGVADKHVTLKSTEGNKFSISLATELVGDITVDNVKASAGNLYCSGHKTIFTENSELTAGTVFGGGNKKTVASTYLVLNGKAHVNKSNNDFNVAAGSYKASVEGDTYLEISGDFTTGNGENGHHITGTNVHSIDGWDSYYQEKTYVGGNVTIIIDINLDHTSVFPVDGTYHSEIKGNLYMAIKSGYVQEICAQQGPSSVNQIGGDVHIVVGDPAYENTDRIVRPSGNWGIYGTGNQFAPVYYYGQLYKVGGNVRIDTYENLWAWGEYNNSRDYPPELHGAYYGDVGGDVTVNVHGSHLRRVYGAE